MLGAAPGGRQFEFNNEEERREAIDHIREMARRKYLGEREVGEEPMGEDGRMGIFGSLWREKTAIRQNIYPLIVGERFGARDDVFFYFFEELKNPRILKIKGSIWLLSFIQPREGSLSCQRVDLKSRIILGKELSPGFQHSGDRSKYYS